MSTRFDDGVSVRRLRRLIARIPLSPDLYDEAADTLAGLAEHPMRNDLLRKAFPETEGIAALLSAYMGPEAQAKKTWIYESPLAPLVLATLPVSALAKTVILARIRPRARRTLLEELRSHLGSRRWYRLEVCLGLVERQEGLTEFGRFEHPQPFSRPQINYYAILGVARTATHGEIRAAMRAISKALHPDGLAQDGVDCQERLAGRTLAEWLTLANEAKDVLLHPGRRQQYDAATTLRARGRFGPAGP